MGRNPSHAGPGFLIHSTGKETLLVPVGGTDFSGLVRGTQTFRAILELLKIPVTEEEIVAGLLDRYDAPEATIRKDVEKMLTALRKIGALEE